MPIWNPRVETMPRVDLEQLQLERLQVIVNRAWDGIPFYRRRFEEYGVIPEHLRSLEDLRLLPFTEKEDLRRGYPYDLFAVPLREVVRIHSSPSTAGTPTVMGYTKNDLRNWRELVARVLCAGGVTKEDVIQISFSYGLLTDAFGFHQGAEEIGASVIPVSAGAVEEQISILHDFRTSALVGTPSHARRIGEALRDKGIPRSSLHLKWAVLGTEPWTEEMRQEIESLLGVSATDNYGIAEVMGPGVAGECEEQKRGLHLNEDHFLCEIVDPGTGEPVPAGATGELVITTLGKEALPLVRYRTGDITSVTQERCACGRTLARMAQVVGRTDDAFVVSGVRLLPAQIEGVLREVDGVKPHFEVILDREGGADTIEVRVEVASGIFDSAGGEVGYLVRTQNSLRQRLEAALGVAINLRLVEPRSLGEAPGMSQRIVDRRRTKGGESGPVL